MRMVDRVMCGMASGRPLDMARASYAYSRACGLTRWQAFAGAWGLFRDYRARQALTGEASSANTRRGG